MFLNDQCSIWSEIEAAVTQGSILAPLLFFFIIWQNLLEGLTKKTKFFGNDASFCLVVHDSTASSVSLNNDLLKISQ